MYISSDTNIWIDFQKIEALDHPFRLNYHYYISSDTFRDEFRDDEKIKTALKEYGLLLTDITDEEFSLSICFQSRYGGLSVYDTFALAIAKQRGWVLLSSDGTLRKAAEKEEVECHGIIWIYDQLKEQRRLSDEGVKESMKKLWIAVKDGRCQLPVSELQKSLADFHEK